MSPDQELRSINMPNIRGYDFGVGIDRLTGTVCTLAVNPDSSPPKAGAGGIGQFSVSRVTSSHDLQSSLGINIQASYGCASFGAGASARFGFVEKSSVHSSTLFMIITATAQLDDLSIDEPHLTTTAVGAVGNQELFKTRYGDMFCRACTRGGLFVGVMQFETFDSTVSDNIEAELKGSYGLFSAEASVNFSKVVQNHDTNLYYDIYYEGGPLIEIHDPTDMQELLEHANTWARSLREDPDRYARPYEWTLSPLTIAEGPPPPNTIDYQHAQDVLQFCARERTSLFDEINELQWYLEHANKYDWTSTAVTQAEVANAVREWQLDLDTAANAASAAMNDTIGAKLPAAYAQQVEGRQYRQVVMPAPLPKPIPADHVDVVSLVRLRVSTVRTILADPGRPYQAYCDWCDATYEPGQVAVKPSPQEYAFLTSGIKVDGDRLHVGSDSGVLSFWSWVVDQSPNTGQVAPTATINLTFKRAGTGYPPPELRPLWGL